MYVHDVILQFGPFRLDTVNRCLWRDGRATNLPPKEYAVLWHLVCHAERLVSKSDLLQAGWPDTAVDQGVLKVSIRKIRRLLGDNQRSPRYIETAHRRGYRFIAAVTSADRPEALEVGSSAYANNRITSIVGRDGALARLAAGLERAQTGRRHTTFVRGEAGIGKTALVDAFLPRIEDMGWAGARGQCVEQRGPGEAFLPVLEAIDRLCRGRDGTRFRTLLARYAPSWMWPAGAARGVSPVDLDSRVTPHRHLRELSETLELFSTRTPVALVFEDLQWSDDSTATLIAYLARRRDPARLLILGTYRSAAMTLAAQQVRSVTSDLVGHRLADELTLEGLSRADVEACLRNRFPVNRLPPGLARVLHERTAGNPLFLGAMLDSLVNEGVIGLSSAADATWVLTRSVEDVAVTVPDGLRPMIEHQLDHLNAGERELLEASSVAGCRFPAVVIAAALQQPAPDVEALYENVNRRSHVVRAVESRELPDGRITAQFAFRHALYRDVLYGGISAGRRAFLHHQIGEQLEQLYGDGMDEAAGELALHFEEGRDYGRAATFLQRATESAIARFAPPEGIALAQRGLACLSRLTPSSNRDDAELLLLATLCGFFIDRGNQWPEREQIHGRIQELLGRVGESPLLLRSLFRLWLYYLTSSPRHAMIAANRLLALATPERGQATEALAHYALGAASYFAGEFEPALRHLERGMALYDRTQTCDAARGGHRLCLRDRRIGLHSWMSLTLWALGRWRESLEHSEEALTIARAGNSSFDTAFALVNASSLHDFRREHRRAGELAAGAVAVVAEEGPSVWLTMAVVQQCWATLQVGIASGDRQLVQQGIEGLHDARAEHLGRGILPLRAHVLAHLGDVTGALEVLKQALVSVEATGARCDEADLLRLEGELLLESKSPSDVEDAEAALRRSLDVSRAQHARSFELRTSVSLARLLQAQERRTEALDVLDRIVPWFSQDDDAADLIQARTLRQELMLQLPTYTM